MTRRDLLGAMGAAAMFPAAAPALGVMTDGAPSPAMEIMLRIAGPETGAGGRRRAVVQGGRVTGNLMHGVVRSGQLEWLVDPLSGAVDLEARVQLLRADGLLVELRDRIAPAAANRFTTVPGWTTAPQLITMAGGRRITSRPLTGRLDTTRLAHGLLKLRVFDDA